MMQWLKLYLPLLAACGGLLLGYDTGMIGSALFFIQSTFHLDNSFQGIVAGTIILGIMLGILGIGWVADDWQRRHFITLATVIYMIGYALAAFSIQTSMLIVGRLIAGIGIGIVLVIVPLYLAEIAPPQLRGRFIAVFQLAITLGIFLGYAMSYWLAHYAAWRFMFGIGLVWGAILFFSSFCLPASPYPVLNTATVSSIEFKKICALKFSRPFLIGMGLAILQQITGINAVMYFAPQILQNLTHQNDISAIFSSLILGGCNFLFTILALFLLDTVGRRPILLLSLFLQFISLAILSALTYQLFPSRDIVYLICLLIYIFGFAIGLGPITWLIISEIYPLAIRSKALAMTVMVNNVAAFIVASSFLSLLNLLKETHTFLLFGFISLLGFIFVWFIVPETKQKSLEEIEVEFNHDNKSY